MARRAAKVDESQPAIVDALRKRGAKVWSLATVGRGFPDLLVVAPGMGARSVWALLEVKTPGGRLTPAQVEWHAANPGVAHVVTTPDEAIAIVFGG